MKDAIKVRGYNLIGCETDVELSRIPWRDSSGVLVQLHSGDAVLFTDELVDQVIAALRMLSPERRRHGVNALHHRPEVSYGDGE